MILATHNNAPGGTVSAAHSESRVIGMMATGRKISQSLDDFIFVTRIKLPSSRAADISTSRRETDVCASRILWSMP